MADKLKSNTGEIPRSDVFRNTEEPWKHWV